jgi:hypothetical protein
MAVVRLEGDRGFALVELQGEVCSDTDVLDGLKLGVMKEAGDKVRHR